MSRQLTIRRRRPTAVVLLLAAAVLLVAALPLPAGLRASTVVQLQVSRTMADHGVLLVQVIVARDADNAFIRVTAESSSYYSSSERDLDGAHATPVQVVQFRDLPAGSYEVSGVVFDQHRHVKGSARQSVLVLPR